VILELGVSFVIVWEFHVRADRLEAFLAAYGPGGAWDGFFRESRGFLGTEVLRDERNPQRVLTIDRWVSASAYEECRWARGDAYDALDLACASLSDRESRLGTFTLIDPAPAHVNTPEGTSKTSERSGRG